MEQRQYFVYILSSKDSGVLYIGMTNNLERRIFEHQNHLIEGFSDKYHVTKLVYFELTDDVRAAIEREKQIKRWSRSKKEFLINTTNPNRIDLSKNDVISSETFS